jgi:hypothetical protein
VRGPCHGTSVSILDAAGLPAVAVATTGAASAMSLAGFDVTRLIAFTSGTSRVTPNIFMIVADQRPGGVDRHARAHVDFGAGEDVAHPHAGDA